MCSYGYVHCYCWYAVIHLDDLMILACTTHDPFVHTLRGGSTREIWHGIKDSESSQGLFIKIFKRARRYSIRTTKTAKTMADLVSVRRH